MTDSSVGDAIYRLRKEHGLSLDDLAERSGVHRNTIHRIESGSSPTLTILSQIARGLGVDTWRLLRYANRLSPQIVTEVVNP